MKTNAKKHIVIVGGGAMGGAIARVVAGRSNIWKTTVIGLEVDKLRALKKVCPSLAVTTEYKSLADADIVILAVKPQSFPDLANSICSLVPKSALVISIMAGVSAISIKKHLGAKRVIRSMPNLGAQFGESMTVWTGTSLTAGDKAFANTFFALLGEHLYVSNEDMVNKTTAVSGSGVGFFAYIVEAYIAEAIKLGFTPKEANQIVLQTFKATNTLLQKKEKTPTELRVAVTSKGGTTEAGLTELMGKDLQQIFGRTFKKAYKRAKELSA